MRQPPDDPIRIYSEREARFGAERAAHERRARTLERARLATALAAPCALALAQSTSGRAAAAWVATAMAASIAFAAAVLAHGRARAAAGAMERLERTNRLAASRARRAWSEIPPSPAAEPPADHPYADDLDLFGRASLWQLLPEVSASPARDVLRGWLLAPASATAVIERQRAVAELAGAIDLRDALASFALTLPAVRPETIDSLAARAGDEAKAATVPAALSAASVALPVVTVGAITAALVAAPERGASALLGAMASLLASLVLTAVTARRTHALFTRFTARADTFELYAGAFDLVAAARFETPLLARLSAEMSAGERPASEQLRRLGRLVQLANTRYSPMLHWPLQLLTLWDVHVARGLERWARDCGAHTARWFAALGELESLSALAALAHANPGWSMPEIAPSDATPRLTARALGHPLIAAELCVTNDVEVGPPGSFLLITGSNMSGKSTLLRAIGLNAVLAQAGAPVCADALHVTPLDTFTSMRVRDSLAQGLSLFMAELVRLKAMVDAARRRAGGRPQLFLLDELLQGTNSAERRLAARVIIGHLVAAGAIGAVTTHDLALAEGAELRAAARPYHMSEAMSEDPAEPALRFAYELTPGLSTSVNAMILLERMGLSGAG